MSADGGEEGTRQQALSFFKNRFGVDEQSLEATLGTALERKRASSPTRAARPKHHDSAPRQHDLPLLNPSRPRSMRIP